MKYRSFPPGVKVASIFAGAAPFLNEWMVLRGIKMMSPVVTGNVWPAMV